MRRWFAPGNPVSKPAPMLAMPMRDEFLVGVDLLAVSRCKDAPSQDTIRINQDRKRQGGGQQREDIRQAESRDRQLRQSSRHLADDRDALRLQVIDCREHDASDDDDERPG